MAFFYHLPQPIPTHDLVSLIHHSIVDSVGVLANILLFFCIVLRSPKSLRSYTVLLLSVNIVDFLATFTSFLTMIRIIPGREALGYIYIGPCVLVSGRFCHGVYALMLTAFNMSMMLMLTSFCYRLYVLTRESPSVRSVLLIATGLLSFNLTTIASLSNCCTNLCIIQMSFYFTLDAPEVVKALVQEARPDYDLDSYVFEGHATILWFMPLMTILSSVLPSIMVSIFFVRRKVLRLIIEKSLHMSAKAREMHSALAKMLSVQAALTITFTGAAYCYSACQMDLMCSPVQEHFIIEVVSYMPTIAPMITIYFLRSYREFVAEMLCFDVKQSNSKNAVASMNWLFHLPHPIPTHDLFSLMHHSVINTTGMFANVLLFVCIILRSPKSLRSFKIILIAANIVDFAASLSAFMTMIRIIPCRSSLEYIFLGPCVVVSGNRYQIKITVSEVFWGFLSILVLPSADYALHVDDAHAYFFLLQTIRTCQISRIGVLAENNTRVLAAIFREPPPIWPVLFVCLIILIVNLLTVMSYYFTFDDPEIVRAIVQKGRPEYDLDTYVFGGHASIFNFVIMMTIICVIVPSVPIMVSTFFVRRKMDERVCEMKRRLLELRTLVIRREKSNNDRRLIQVLRLIEENYAKMCVKTSEMHSDLAKMLSVQAVLTSLFSVAAYCYLACQIDLVCSLIQEHFIIEFVSYMPPLSQSISLNRTKSQLMKC